MKFARTSGIVAIIGLFASTAMAADLDPIFADDANMLKPAELGSGWYLRGDISFNIPGSQVTISDLNPSDSPLASTEFESGDYSDRVGFSAGFGKQISNKMRFDVSIGRSKAGQLNAATSNLRFTGSETLFIDDGAGNITEATAFFDEDGIVTAIDCAPTETGCDYTLGEDTDNEFEGTRTASADYNKWDAIGSVYYDAQPVYGLRPYIGIGGGLSRAEVTAHEAITCNEGANQTCYTSDGTAFTDFPEGGGGHVLVDRSETKYLPSARLSAGVSYEMAKNTTFDLGYSYTHTFGFEDMFESVGADVDGASDGTHALSLGVRLSSW